MKKLGKLNLKQMEQEMPVIETMEQMKIFGGCVSSYVWHSWSDSKKLSTLSILIEMEVC